MAFVFPLSVVRRSPLGPQRLNRWLENLAWLRRGLQRQHLVDTGEHNALEIPRVCRRVTFTGPATYALANTSGDITSVTRVAAGHCRLGLSARFSADMRVQVNVSGAGAEDRPFIPRVVITSATQIEVYLDQLTSALGVGNAWAPADVSFDIAIHAAPLPQVEWAANPWATRFPTGWTRGQTLGTDAPSDFNATLWHLADYRRAFLAEHLSSGLHNSRQIARRRALMRYRAPGAYDLIEWDGPGAAPTVTETSIGAVDVTWDSMTTAISPFISPDWTRQVTSAGAPGDFTIIHAQTPTSTLTKLWMYRFDKTLGTWSRARSDFWGVWHSG